MSDNAGHSQGKTIFAYKIRKETKVSVKVEFWAECGNVVAEFLNENIASYIAQIEDAISEGVECLNYLDGSYVMPSSLLASLKRDFSSYIVRVNDANNSGASTPNCKDTQSRTKASAQVMPARQISKTNAICKSSAAENFPVLSIRRGRSTLISQTTKL